MGPTSTTSVPIDPRFAEPRTIFYCIGAQKSGTTWLADYLEKHPDVAIPAWKEQNYWTVIDGARDLGRNLEARRARRMRQGRFIAGMRDFGLTAKARRNRSAGHALRAGDAAGPPHGHYADAIFAEVPSTKCKAAGEISPIYDTLSAATYSKMREISETTRFIYILRDPISRCVSAVKHGLRRSGKADSITQSEFDAIFESALSGDGAFSPLVRSRYDLHIARLESVVPSHAIGYYFFETLFDQNVIDDICAFLQIATKDADVSRVVLAGTAKHVALSEKHRAVLQEKLEPCYDAMRRKFGDRLPSRWAQSEPMEMADAT